MKILLDSIDKRMTVPLIDQLVSNGYTVDGLGFKGDNVLNGCHLNAIHEIDKNDIDKMLVPILNQYSKVDVLILGNPLILDSIDRLKPSIGHIIPSSVQVAKANNKQLLGELANSLDVPYPKELDAVCVGSIAKLKNSEGTKLKPAERYRIIEDEEGLLSAQPFLKEHEGNLIFQDYVSGDGFGVSMLLDSKSQLVDYICHKRLLEYPISGGPSALCESIYDQRMIERAYRILRALRWQGLAMVEFKGEHLIEINPRFWGSMPLIFRSDSKFFLNYIKMVKGEYSVIDTNHIPYNVGVKMSYFPQGLIAILAHMKAGRVAFALKRLVDVGVSKEGVFRWSNPKPFFRYVKGLFSR